MAFPETNWSILAEATLHGDESARTALGDLCQQYWQPVYVAIRSRGYGDEDARDHTQGFFEYLLEGAILCKADQAQGKFRTFLLTVLWRFLNDERKKQAAEKRWGGQRRESLDVSDYEIAADEESLTQVLDHEWAVSVMQRTLSALKEEVVGKQGEAGWELLRRFLPGSREVPVVEEVAELLNISNPGARTEIHRLRNRFREMLRRQLMGTVTRADELDEEIRYLGQVLRGRVVDGRG